MPPVGALRIGTSSFTAAGWRRAFYPERLKQPSYLNYYATQFDTVEIDSTWYGLSEGKHGSKLGGSRNNHYSGHAPANVREFLTGWKQRPELAMRAAYSKETKFVADASL